MVNEGLQFLRKEKTRAKIEKHVEIDESEIVTFNTALQNMEEDERKARINNTLLQLKPKESLVLELYYLHDEPIAQIAQITGFSLSNVKVLLHRARKSFALMFNNSNYNQ